MRPIVRGSSLGWSVPVVIVSVSVSLPAYDLRYFKLVHFDKIFVIVKQCHSDIKILNHNLTWPTAHYRTSLNSAPSYFAKVSPRGRVALWPIGCGTLWHSGLYMGEISQGVQSMEMMSYF